MLPRQNGQSRRRWFHCICSVSISDSSDSDESEAPHDYPLTWPETPSTVFEDATPYTNSHSAAEPEDDWQWQLFPPPPPPVQPPRLPTDGDWQPVPPRPPISFQIPLRHMRNHDRVQPTRGNVTEIFEVEDDDREGNKMDVVKNMEITEALMREKTICPICKEEFKLGEDASRLPCDHFFCFKCIHTWLNKSNTCPVCRRHLPPPGDSGLLSRIPRPRYDTSLAISVRTLERWENFFFPLTPSS